MMPPEVAVGPRGSIGGRGATELPSCGAPVTHLFLAIYRGYNLYITPFIYN